MIIVLKIIVLVFFRYNIDNLYYDRFYLVNVVALFCYESTGVQCAPDNTFTILENAMFPKKICGWNEGYRITSMLK